MLSSHLIFSIRDDDTSFFTKPDDLEEVYASYFGKIPISLAVVPFSVPDHRGRSFDNRLQVDHSVPLGENKILVEWLREKIRLGQIEIMLHGFSHQYKKINGIWVGEYGWKSAQQLFDETLRGKSYLEQLLNINVKVFVPPSNTIGKAGMVAIRKAGLHLSGIMGRGGDRPLTPDYPLAYLRRWVWRLLRGDAYPFPIELGGIKELRAYALTPRADASYLLEQLRTCARLRAPFVVATHYWEFKEVPEMHMILADLIEAAVTHQFKFLSVKECYRSDADF